MTANSMRTATVALVLFFINLPALAKDASSSGREESINRLVDTYATVLFASYIENRCDHLDPDLEVIFFNNLISIENFVSTLVPPESIVQIKANASREAADKAVNPCGSSTMEFIKRVYPYAAQVSENINQAAGLAEPNIR